MNFLRRMLGLCPHLWTGWEMHGLRRHGHYWVCHCSRCGRRS